MNTFGHHLLFDPYINGKTGNYEDKVLESFIENVQEFMPDEKKNILTSLNNAKSWYAYYPSVLKYHKYENGYYETNISHNYKELTKDEKLKPLFQHNYLLVSGYASKGQAHSIMIQIKPSTTQYDIYIYNSGDGIEYNENGDAGIVHFTLKKDDQSIYYLMAHIMWMLMAGRATYDYGEMLNADVFYNRIQEIIETKKCSFYNYADRKYYGVYYKHSSSYKFKVIPKQQQFSGSCTFYSKMYWLEHVINDDKIFNKFVNDLRNKYLNKFMDEIKEQTSVNDHNILYLLTLRHTYYE